MPGPFDMLKKAGAWAINPLIDAETIAPAQDMIDSPSLDRSPMEARMRGFGAGALEGLRGFTSPLSLASMAAPALGAFRGAGRVASKAAPTLDVVEPSVVKQVAPAIDDVDALIGDMQRNLARVPNKRPAPMETLGERAAEFTPRGGEGMYNTGKNLHKMEPLDGFYQNLLQNLGGRGR